MATILPDRLRAAVERSRLSYAEIAKRLGDAESRQLVHHLAQGDEPKRTRYSRRRRIARILRVPESWLGGKRFELPFVAGTDLETRSEGSPRAALAIEALLRRCVVACENDLKTFRAVPSEGVWFTPAQEAITLIVGAIYGFVDSARWRQELTGWSDPARVVTPEEREYQAALDAQSALPPDADAATIHAAGRRTGDASMRLRALPMSPEEETATIALVDGLSYALDPWLRGVGRLRYDRLVEILLGHAPGAYHRPPNSKRPDFIERESGARLSPDDPRTPFYVVGWAEPAPPAADANGSDQEQ